MIRPLTLALLACASTLAAVEPPPELAQAMRACDDLARELGERLRSGDARQQAWAAYEVGAHRVAGAREALLPLLAQVPPKEDAPSSCRYRSAIDALIRLDGTPPAAVVAAAAADPRFQAEAIILAARDPAANLGALLGLLDTTAGDAAWLAVCELLEDQRPPRLAEHLLGGLSLRLALNVRDGYGGSGGSKRAISRFGTSRLEFPDGFPPYALSYLTAKPEPGATVLTAGFQTVHWVRVEIESSGSGYCRGSSPIDRDAASIDLLGRLTRPWTLSQLKPLERTTLVWSDAAAYRKGATEAYERIRDERQRLIDRLIEERLLPTDAAGRIARPITVTVSDDRHAPADPLPALPFPTEAAAKPPPAAAAPAPSDAGDDR